MRKTSLFEFEDLSWFPSFIRDGGTDFLGLILRITKYYEPAVLLLEDVVKKTGQTQILDLCSGNGGPIEFIHENIDPSLNVSFMVSDKYPNLPAYKQLQLRTNNKVNYYSDALDALDVNENIPGVRTMFSAIHHFEPKDVKSMFHKMVNGKKTICIFDSGDKHLGTILGILLFHPILFLILTPFIKPFKLSRILFTYLIPVIPIYTIWDGIVSILRLYSSKELMVMAQDVDTKNEFNWSYGKERNTIGFTVAYLIGIPKQAKL
ncbi:MAG: hypothetical protein AAFX55_19380 [Bacteroidota bacterium]